MSILWQKITAIDNQPVGEPGELPVWLDGLSAQDLANLNWVIDKSLGFDGFGFTPVITFDPPPVPTDVPMYKARKVLITRGLMGTVSNAIASMAGEAGDLARVDWEYAPNLVRDSALVENLAAAIGLTSAQIDALVIEASNLP